MISFQTPLLRFLMILSGLYSLVTSCSTESKSDCYDDASSNEGDWVRCDLCVCDNFDDFTDDEKACSASNNDLYNCYIKQDVDLPDITWSCKVCIVTIQLILFKSYIYIYSWHLTCVVFLRI